VRDVGRGRDAAFRESHRGDQPEPLLVVSLVSEQTRFRAERKAWSEFVIDRTAQTIVSKHTRNVAVGRNEPAGCGTRKKFECRFDSNAASGLRIFRIRFLQTIVLGVEANIAGQHRCTERHAVAG
jgi:hypothetical protein